MVRPLVLALTALQLFTASAAVGWMYASHKYDCFNIGPCVGDIDRWSTFGDFAFVAFLTSWVALVTVTALYSMRTNRALTNTRAWGAAILLPPIVLFSAHWLFNLGISATPA